MAAVDNRWIVIGISGATCGGKTTLAKRLADLLMPAVVYNQDYYFYPDDSPHHIKCDGIDHNNYDILSSLDMERMYSDVVDTMRGKAPAHVCDASVGRPQGRFYIPGARFLIVEGFTVLNYKPIFDLCHLRYYVVLDYEECLRRRRTRHYEPPDVPGYFERCVWPEHLRYKKEVEATSGITIVDGARDDALAKVMSELRALGLRELSPS